MLFKSLSIGLVGSFIFAFSSWAGTSALEGVVKDPGGRPIKGATVQIEAKNGTKFSKTVKTDSNGHYISDSLAVGTYKVTLVVNGSVKASIVNATTKSGGPTQLNFDMTSKTASAKTHGKTHRVWVPADTGTHIGNGTWVEVDENGVPVNDAGGVNRVEKMSGNALSTLHVKSQLPGQ
jgi:hypothetical protein